MIINWFLFVAVWLLAITLAVLMATAVFCIIKEAIKTTIDRNKQLCLVNNLQGNLEVSKEDTSK